MSDARELAELISSGEAVPASGWVAGVSAALAAALVAKAAKRSEGWSEAAGCRAQAIDRRDRLLALAAQDSRAYERALAALDDRDHKLPGALAKAAEVPLAIAEASADVATPEAVATTASSVASRHVVMAATLWA